MKTNVSKPRSPYVLAPFAITLGLFLPCIGWAGVEIDQQPLTVGKPLEPNIWFILDDSASMERTWMPQSLANSGVNHLIYTRNTIYYNPHVDYQPWRNADGTQMLNADRTKAFSNVNNLTAPTNLTNNSQCFHTPKDNATGDTGLDSSLYRWRLNSGGATASRCDANATCINDNGCQAVTQFQWTRPDGKVITRSVAEEWQNYANWYQYYRTRMKMAKASVTQAFADIEENFRFGYTSIFDIGKFEIPYNKNDGLFDPVNREAWFKSFMAATAHGGNTPLRVALARAGEYFRTADPYKNSDNIELSCRQNFTILTTDGEWNESNTLVPVGVRGNHDGTDGPEVTGPKGASYKYMAVAPYADAHSLTTLADVAMYYWKNDLRPTENNVPTTGSNPAFWQHMRTFGVSIGMQGTLDPNMTAEDLKKVTWPNPNTAARKIDDLFHATVNSRGKFIVANNADEFTKALKDSLADIAAEKGRSASGAASSTNVSAGGMTYFSEFVSGTWSGDVHGYGLDPKTGRRSADPKDDWSASKVLPAWDARNIVYNNGVELEKLTWGVLDSTQKAALGSEQILNYIRGERSNERTTDNPEGSLRERDSALGSFVNSQLTYVGQPPFSKYYESASTPGASEYAAHATAKKSRPPVLYVGSNAGLLHGFDATTGEELFAFMPTAVMTEDLQKYATDPDYEHRYFVDGELTAAEVYLNGAWRTVLVGSLGRGGRSVFALDVTDPTKISLLWEKTEVDIPAMGNTLGKPIIAEVGYVSDTQSDWRVLLGNGPNSNGDRAQLLTISLVNGEVKTYDTGASGDNGLSAVLVWDADKDGYFETVYAGDLKGNLWRFSNLHEDDPDDPFKLFTTNNNQPITASPWAAVNQKDQLTWVFVGTGQYLNETDRGNTDVQSWYGLIDNRTADDPGTTIGERSTSLVERKILSTDVINDRGARTLEMGTESQIAPAGKRGWFIDLTHAGERMITPNSFYGSALIGTTFIPDGTDLCNPDGRSALWGINPFTGGRLSKALFDFDRNGIFDEQLGGIFPSVIDNLKPILVGTPPTTIVEDGDRRTVIMHTDPDDSEEFLPPSGEAETRSWREVFGE